jgi:hypothetical protein
VAEIVSSMGKVLPLLKSHCYDPVWDRPCDSTINTCVFRVTGLQGKMVFHAWRSGVEKRGEDL